MIYLASPYSSKDSFVRVARYKCALRATADLMKRDEIVFCPVAYGHSIENKLQTEFSYDYWIRWSRVMLAGASKVYVLTIPGWEHSDGVREEVRLAHALCKPIIGYGFGPDAEDIAGCDILAAFGLATHRSRPDTTPRHDAQVD